MAKSTNRDIVVSDFFGLPPNVVDVRHAEVEDYSSNYDNTTVATPGPVLDTPASSVPSAPTSFVIVSQTVKLNPDGTGTTDVIIELPDIQGVYSYDVRVTKA